MKQPIKDSLSLESLQRIEQICDRFEKSENRDIAQLLIGAAGVERIYLLKELVALDIELRIADGETVNESMYKELADQPGEQAVIVEVFRQISESEDDEPDLKPKHFSIGQKIGSYIIERELGQGGMGVVYLAKREKDFEKQVAIKVIRKEYLNDQLVSRFRDEMKIQGAIGDHPNIASLVDAGNTTEGIPYLVMEYCDGNRLDEYLNRNELSVNQRLSLFKEILSGVAFAHQNAIIHRDLKPSNILVDKNGHPKIIDFGLAKLIDPAKDQQSATIAMTPMYASPEQVRGENISTSSDVYSSGVVLYEMLTNQSPYSNNSGSIKELISLVTDSHPKPPSQRLREEIDAQKETQIRSQESTLRIPKRQFEKQVSGDLDQIVLKALRKDPNRRYKTINEFSADIQRFLENKTVSARPDNWTYRASKFIARNRVVVAASLLFIATLVAGIVGTATGWKNSVEKAEKLELEQTKLKAEREKLKVANREIADNLELLQKSAKLNRKTIFEFMTEVSSSRVFLASTPRAQELRISLFTKAKLQFETMISQLTDSDEDRQELAKIHYWLGNINHDLGRDDDAIINFDKAINLFNDLLLNHPDNEEYLDDLAVCLNDYGDQQRKFNEANSLKKSEELFEKSLDLKEQQLSNDPENFRKKMQVIRTLQNLSAVSRNLNKLEKARQYTSRSNQLCVAQRKTLKENVELNFLTSVSHSQLASDLYYQRKYQVAQTEFEKSLELAKELLQNDRNDNDLMWLNANSLYHIGYVKRLQRNYAGAMQSYNEAMPIAEQMMELNPGVVKNQVVYGNLLNGMGAAFLSQQDYDNAKKPLEAAVKVYRELSTQAPGRRDFRTNLQATLTNLSYVFRYQQRVAEAIDCSLEAIEIGEELAGKNSTLQLKLQILAAKGNLGSFMGEVGRIEEGEKQFLSAIEGCEKLLEANPENLMPKLLSTAMITNLGSLYGDSQRHDKALTQFDKAIKILTEIHQNSPQVPQASQFLANAHKGRGDAYYWKKDYKKSIENYDKSMTFVSSFRMDVEIDRACALFASGQKEPAIKTMEEILGRRKGDPSVPFYATTFFGSAASLAENEEARNGYLSSAMEQLRRAEKDNYAMSPKSIEVLKTHPKLNLFREFPEYQDWFKAKIKPAK